MQESTTDKCGRSHPPQCTTSLEDRTTDVSIANGAMKEGCGWQNGIKFSLQTSHASVFNITMIGFESGDAVEIVFRKTREVVCKFNGNTNIVLNSPKDTPCCDIVGVGPTGLGIEEGKCIIVID
ncbi:uncharacterized protein TNCV_1351541 [Trichonephila clavipes]|nr:uncharacterized protein TNCV_1351541 [Trichonephila clavipes]